MSNKEEPKASDKYWDKNGFYQGDEKYSGYLENKYKDDYDQFVSLEAKIELAIYLNLVGEISPRVYKERKAFYQSELDQLKEKHGL